MTRLRPLIPALRSRKASVLLLVVQIVATVAFVCNAIFVIQQRLAISGAPSGVPDENDVLVIPMQWQRPPPDASAREQTDLLALRSIPSVADATVSSFYPFENSGGAIGVTLQPDKPQSGVLGFNYYFDAHGLNTLGLTLVAGRNFLPTEVLDQPASQKARVQGVIITRSLASKLSPDGQVVGRLLTIRPDGITSPIIGVVERLQSSFGPLLASRGAFNALAGNSVIFPYRMTGPPGPVYLVRAKRGLADLTRKVALAKLIAPREARVVGPVKSLSELRREAYRAEAGVAGVLGVICVVLIVVLAFGIAGQASHWVSQRRREIGIMRALGASRTGVLRHFQVEILCITATGAMGGIALGQAANLWMTEHMAMVRLPVGYLLAGAITVLAICQVTALGPARSAARVPPAIAARGN